MDNVFGADHDFGADHREIRSQAIDAKTLTLLWTRLQPYSPLLKPLGAARNKPLLFVGTEKTEL
jgi:hypothetical protein